MGYDPGRESGFYDFMILGLNFVYDFVILGFNFMIVILGFMIL